MKVSCPNSGKCPIEITSCCHEGVHDAKNGCFHDLGEGGCCPNCVVEEVEDPLPYIFMVERSSLGGYETWVVGHYPSFSKAISAVLHHLEDNKISYGNHVSVNGSYAEISIHEDFGSGSFLITKNTLGGKIAGASI